MLAPLILCLAVSAAPPEPETESKTTWKQRKVVSEEDLRKQLLAMVPDVGLNQEAAAQLHAGLTEAAAARPQVPFDAGPRFYVQAVPVAASTLTWHRGQDAALGKEAAERLHVLSTALRDGMQKATPSGDVRPNPGRLRATLADNEEWRTPEAIPTLMQLLQAEGTPLRMLLVETLAQIKGAEASKALAQRAVFDLSAEVRKKATLALASRPAAEFEQVFLDALRYPWAPAADHAAESIVALGLKSLTPRLIPLLKESNPSLPYQEKNIWKVRTLVRFNHLCNCVVCHAPSQSKEDLVRGLVPKPGEEPPPLYYKGGSGVFIRASVTFLRQDFSVVQPVEQPGKWATHQRYDYLVQTRPLTPAEVKLVRKMQKKGDFPTTFEQREAVLFALRALTNRERGSRFEDWVPLLQGLESNETQGKG
jgi:hypothetical protein